MAAPSLTLDLDIFDALRRLICERCGIWLGDSKFTFLQVRLADRLRARNISSAQEYYYFVKYDAHADAEMQQLIDAVTVNETWFFREIGPVEAWLGEVAPDLVARGKRLGLWSAGCATGEEPYTLAMLLLENYPATALSRFEILATDISQRALETARAGIYDPYSLRRTEQYWQAKYLHPTPDGRQKVLEAVRRPIRFGQANLIDPTLAQRVQAMDLILCRNVLIYLNDRGRQAALDNLYAALRPGGYLILGHSESLIHAAQAPAATSFEVVRVGGTIIYRKK
jgi:chemotaxis protein methyltransferase CheR